MQNILFKSKAPCLKGTQAPWQCHAGPMPGVHWQGPWGAEYPSLCLATLLSERSPVHALRGSVVTLCLPRVFFLGSLCSHPRRLALAPNHSLCSLVSSGGAFTVAGVWVCGGGHALLLDTRRTLASTQRGPKDIMWK